MSRNFMIILLLSSLYISGVVSATYDVIPKYGEKKTSGLRYAVLDTSGFEVGDEIYISVTAYYRCNNYYDLYYRFYETIEGKSSLSYSDSVYYSSISYTESFNSYEETINYKIKKQKSNDNFLYMESKCSPPLYFENTESDTTKVILIVSIVVSIVVLAIIITVVVCMCRRCKRNAAYGAVAYNQPIGYSVSPYAAQPVVGVNVVQPMHPVQPMQAVQPVMNAQPYTNYAPNQNYNQNVNNQDVQYSSITPGQASDNRMNPNINYEKPH